MQDTNRKDEDASITIKGVEYQIPPKEGFILTHFLTVAYVKRSAEFYLRILDGKLLLKANQPSFKSLTAG